MQYFPVLKFWCYYCRDPWQDVPWCVWISSRSCDISQVFSNFELYNMIRLGVHLSPSSTVWLKPRKFDYSDFSKWYSVSVMKLSENVPQTEETLQVYFSNLIGGLNLKPLSLLCRLQSSFGLRLFERRPDGGAGALPLCCQQEVLSGEVLSHL